MASRLAASKPPRPPSEPAIVHPAPALLARNPTIRRWTRSVWRALLKTFLGDRVVQDRMGLTLLLDLDNPIDKYVAAFGQWENDRIAYLLRAARDLGGADLFLDIGAHWGLYALSAWKAGIFERVVAFEPARARADQLRANTFLNRVERGIELVEAAASDRPGRLELGEGGRIREDPAGAESVHAVRIDDEILIEGGLVVAKIDVEGFEDRALAGMHRLLTHNRCLLQIEIWAENVSAITELLERQGYGLVHRIGHDHYFRNF